MAIVHGINPLNIRFKYWFHLLDGYLLVLQLPYIQVLLTLSLILWMIAEEMDWDSNGKAQLQGILLCFVQLGMYWQLIMKSLWQETLWREVREIHVYKCTYVCIYIYVVRLSNGPSICGLPFSDENFIGKCSGDEKDVPNSERTGQFKSLAVYMCTSVWTFLNWNSLIRY